MNGVPTGLGDLPLLTDRPAALASGQVHVVLAEPDAMDRPGLDQAAGLLDAAERERAARFHFERDRTVFVAAHALTRCLLAHHGAGRPEGLRFAIGPAGKPALPGSPLRFSLSHTAGLATCAVMRDHEIGVDVEAVDPARDLEPLAADVFTDDERRCLGASPGPERARTFLRLWTLKEALLKATGEGLSRPPASFGVSLLPLSLIPPTAEWSLAQWLPTGRHVLSLAVHRPGPVEVRLSRWR